MSITYMNGSGNGFNVPEGEAYAPTPTITTTEKTAKTANTTLLQSETTHAYHIYAEDVGFGYGTLQVNRETPQNNQTAPDPTFPKALPGKSQQNTAAPEELHDADVGFGHAIVRRRVTKKPTKNLKKTIKGLRPSLFGRTIESISYKSCIKEFSAFEKFTDLPLKSDKTKSTDKAKTDEPKPKTEPTETAPTDALNQEKRREKWIKQCKERYRLSLEDIRNILEPPKTPTSAKNEVSSKQSSKKPINLPSEVDKTDAPKPKTESTEKATTDASSKKKRKKRRKKLSNRARRHLEAIKNILERFQPPKAAKMDKNEVLSKKKMANLPEKSKKFTIVNNKVNDIDTDARIAALNQQTADFQKKLKESSYRFFLRIPRESERIKDPWIWIPVPEPRFLIDEIEAEKARIEQAKRQAKRQAKLRAKTQILTRSQKGPAVHSPVEQAKPKDGLSLTYSTTTADLAGDLTKSQKFLMDMVALEPKYSASSSISEKNQQTLTYLTALKNSAEKNGLDEIKQQVHNSINSISNDIEEKAIYEARKEYWTACKEKGILRYFSWIHWIFDRLIRINDTKIKALTSKINEKIEDKSLENAISDFLKRELRIMEMQVIQGVKFQCLYSMERPIEMQIKSKMSLEKEFQYERVYIGDVLTKIYTKPITEKFWTMKALSMQPSSFVKYAEAAYSKAGKPATIRCIENTPSEVVYDSTAKTVSIDQIVKINGETEMRMTLRFDMNKEADEKEGIVNVTMDISEINENR